MSSRARTGVVLGLLLIVAALGVLFSLRQQPTRTPAAVTLDLPTRYPRAERIVAIGDLHGDLAATRAALRLARVIDDEDRWSGGGTVLVQTGDQLDRGDDELEILDLLESLAEQARAAGGAVHVLNGNHELMNVEQDLRYVTLGGFLDFLPFPISDPQSVAPEVVVDAVHERLKAVKPGRPFAMRLAGRNVVAVIGDTVLVHGGVLPRVVDYGLERLNQEARDWVRDDRPYPPEILLAADGPVWSRHYSDDPDAEDCRLLREALDELGARRMVVGHTVQDDGINPACGDMVWRIDVGLARHYGGSPAVLEIEDGAVGVIEQE
jgi:hypothetical protein